MNTGLDFLVFFLLCYGFSVPVVWANTGAFGVAVISSYFLNRYWTFSDRSQSTHSARQIPLFFICNGGGLLLSNLVVANLAPIITVPGAKICATGVSFVWNFWSTRRFVFRAPAANQMDQPRRSGVAMGSLASTLTRDYWIVAAIAAATALRLFDLGSAPLVTEELAIANWSTLSFGETRDAIFSKIGDGQFDSVQLPFYLIIISGFAHLAGTSAWALRLPGVIFSILAVGISAAVGRQLVGIVAARWVAWLTALSPFLIQHARDAREFGLVSALTAWSLLLLARFLTQRNTSLGLLFIAVNLALLATHCGMAFFVGAEILVLLIVRPQPWRSWLGATAVLALAAAAVVFIALLLLPRHPSAIFAAGAADFPDVIGSLLAAPIMLPNSLKMPDGGWRAALPYLPLSLAATGSFAWFLLGGIRRVPPRSRILLPVILSCVLAGCFLAYPIFPQASLDAGFLAAAAPAFFVLLAAGIESAGTGRVARLASAVILAFLLEGSIRQLAYPEPKSETTDTAGESTDAPIALSENPMLTPESMPIRAYSSRPHR